MRTLEGCIDSEQALLWQYSSRLAGNASMLALNNVIRGTKRDLESIQSVLASSRLRASADLAPAVPEGDPVDELQSRCTLAAGQLHSMIRHMERLYRQISVVFPTRSRESATVTSRAIPGNALGPHRAREPSAVHGAGGVAPGRYREVPGAVLTILYDARDQLLFRALHHNLFSTPELAAEALARLSDADLNALARELLVPEGCKLRIGETRSEQAGRHCRAFRQGGSQALTVAQAMTRRACAQMARATAAAALAADGTKLRCALDGQVVDLRLFLISLLQTGQAATWCEQAAAFEELEQQQPVELLVGRPGVEPRNVQVRIRVSQFVFSTDREELNEHAIPPPDRALAELFGEGPGQPPGGRVGACLDAVKGFVTESHKACAGVLPDVGQSVPGPGTPAAPLTHPPAQGAESLIDVKLLECEVHTLEAACRQLKRDWAPDGTWPADPEIHTQAAARLALIAYLIGEAPILSCAKASGLTRQLDAEAQFLATVARHHDGQLPKLEPAAIQTTVRRVEVCHAAVTPVRVEFSDDRGDPPWAAHLVKQPPNLQHTRVQTAQGTVLYEGLYHDTFNAARVSGPILARWSTGELMKHVEFCLVGAVDSPTSWETVNAACARIRQDPEIAAQFARQSTNLLGEQTAMAMARNTVTASLYVDDGRRRTIAQALVGETVDAHLFNVWLLAPSAVEMVEKQLRALNHLANLPPDLLPQAASSPGARPVSVEVSVRGFPLPVTTEPLQPQLSEYFQAEMRRLLGDRESKSLGGQLACEIADLQAHSLRVDVQEGQATQGHAQRVFERADDRAAARKTNRPTDDLESGSTASRTSARFLQAAGLRLKQIWADELGPDDADPEASMQAAALLSLIGYNLGATPVLSCAPVGNCINKLNRAVEQYALAAHNNRGYLSVHALDKLLWRQVRDAFNAPS